MGVGMMVVMRRVIWHVKGVEFGESVQRKEKHKIIIMAMLIGRSASPSLGSGASSRGEQEKVRCDGQLLSLIAAAG